MRRLIALFALALSSSAIACGSDNGTNPPVSLAGTWVLTTVNGGPLPATVNAADPKIDLLGDQIVATAAGTFTESGSARFTELDGTVSTVSFNDSGTWTVTGTTATFRFTSDGSTGTAVVDGNMFTVTGSGVAEVYVKQ